MTKDILRQIENAIELEKEITNEYMRLKEKRANAQFGEVVFTDEDKAQLKLLYHLTSYFA